MNESPRQRVAVPDLVPWGQPPTPLLPQWYREELGHIVLPGYLTPLGLAQSPETIGELCDLWEEDHSPEEWAALTSAAPLEFLKDTIGDLGWPPDDVVVVPDGTNKSTINHYPLTARTLHALQSNGLLQGDRGITVDDMNCAYGIGLVSTVELMCLAESAIPELRSVPEVVQSEYLQEHASDPHRPSTDWLGPIGQLLAAAREFYGAHSVLDALMHDLMGIASAAGIAPDLEGLSIGTLTRGARITDRIADGLADLYTSLSSRDRRIVDARLGIPNPQTMQALASEFGVSRARIGQIQQSSYLAIEERVGADMSFVVGILHDKMGPVVPEDIFANELESVFGGDSFPKELSQLATQLAKSQLNYSLANGILVDEDGKLVAGSLRVVARDLCDDVGLVDETTLRASLPGREWEMHFDGLVDWCGFHRFGVRLALRDTIGARVKAALLEIGRPATLEEVCNRANCSEHQTRAKLSAISTVARASKTEWGLREWIDDEYEGIPAEIIQRINEDGGATRLARLTEELPRLFGVAAGSVRACVGTPQFILREGYVSLADASDIVLGKLADVTDGVNADGNPYWTFTVESRYFDGFSLPHLPPEVARELGCQPNGKTALVVVRPEHCPPLSVSWRLSSASGAGLGYLAQPLELLGARSGDRIRLIMVGRGHVALEKEDETTMVDFRRRPSSAALLRRLKSRRSLGLDDA